MPNQSHSGIHGDPWHRCDCCGFDYRTSQLRRQNNFIVCAKCYDDPSNNPQHRDAIIQQVLTNSSEEMQLAPILREPASNDDDFPFGG